MFKWKRIGAVVLAAAIIAATPIGTVTAFADDEPYQKEFSYQTDRVMDGVYGEEILYFQIPDYWITEGAVGEFSVRLSPMLMDIPASLTFLLNGVPVKSLNLNYADGEEQEFTIPLPTTQLQEGYNSLAVTGYAQIYDEEGCLDEFSGANWIIIEENSGVSVQYRLKTPSYTIAEYPYPLISTENETGAGIAVVVPDGATADELTAAAWVRAGLTKKTGQADEIEMLYQSKYAQTPMPAVVVSLYERLPENLRDTVAAHGVPKSACAERVVPLFLRP